MSVAELKERHAAATTAVNSLRERLKQRRLLLLDTDSRIHLPFDFESAYLLVFVLKFSDLDLILQSQAMRERRDDLRLVSALRISSAAGRCRGILER